MKEKNYDEKLFEFLNCKEGDVICDECDGKGYTDGGPFDCHKCHGMGKLDWIENIVGKAPSPLFSIWSDPGNNPPKNPVHGTTYYNTTKNKVFAYNGSEWVAIESNDFNSEGEI